MHEKVLIKMVIHPIWLCNIIFLPNSFTNDVFSDDTMDEVKEFRFEDDFLQNKVAYSKLALLWQTVLVPIYSKSDPKADEKNNNVQLCAVNIILLEVRAKFYFDQYAI